ncbi:MAG: hypothetical protein LBN41_04315 [Enterobacteriaceae bacterium]|jgi:hypothetical protein|nr:hypothetical protein [Enterobacteriaceae bacterium]
MKMKVKQHNEIEGEITGRVIQFDGAGDELIRITNDNFEGWFHTYDIEPVKNSE